MRCAMWCAMRCAIGCVPGWVGCSGAMAVSCAIGRECIAVVLHVHYMYTSCAIARECIAVVSTAVVSTAVVSTAVVFTAVVFTADVFTAVVFTADVITAVVITADVFTVVCCPSCPLHSALGQSISLTLLLAWSIALTKSHTATDNYLFILLLSYYVELKTTTFLY